MAKLHSTDAFNNVLTVETMERALAFSINGGEQVIIPMLNWPHIAIMINGLALGLIADGLPVVPEPEGN